MVRKKGVLFLLIIAAVITAIAFIFNNAWLQRIIESSASSVVGARVEFRGFAFSIFGMRLGWRDLQVANPRDPWRNLIETGTCEVDLSLEPLLLKRFVVPTIGVDSLRFNTRRSTDGSLPGKKGVRGGFIDRVQELLDRELAILPVVETLLDRKYDVKSLLAAARLQAPQRIDSLMKVLSARRDEWGARLQGLPSKEDIDRIRLDLDSIDATSVGSPQNLLAALSRVNSIRIRIDTLNRRFDTARIALQRDIEELRGFDTAAQNWIMHDYRRLLQLAHFPDITANDIAVAILGRPLVNKIQTVLTYVGRARYYESEVRAALPPKSKQQPRLTGQTIHFSAKRDWPPFWLKNGNLSAVVFNSFASGAVGNITARQDITKLPATFGLSGKRGQTAVSLDGILNYIGETPKELFKMSAQGVDLAGLETDAGEFFPSRIASGTGDMGADIAIDGQTLSALARFAGYGLSFLDERPAGGLHPQLAAFRRMVAGSLHSLAVSATIKAVGERLNLNVSSSALADIAGALQGTVMESLSQSRGELLNAAKKNASGRYDNLRYLIGNETTLMNSRLAAIQGLLAEVQGAIDAKRAQLRRKITPPGFSAVN
jgi:uncharacterized protein (TIGR03545 family)